MNNVTQILKNEILNSCKNNNVYIIKNFDALIPTWNEIVNLIDHVHSEEYISSGIRKDKVGLSEDLYLRIADAIVPNTNFSSGNTIPGLEKILDFFEYVFEEKSKYAECYINFTTNTPFKLPHNDQWVAIAWDCIGNIEWKIYEDFDAESTHITYITNPGDIIIIPKGVIHSVVPLTPRASISIGYNFDDKLYSK